MDILAAAAVMLLLSLKPVVMAIARTCLLSAVFYFVVCIITVWLYSTAYAAVLLFCVRFSWIGAEFSRVELKFK